MDWSQLLLALVPLFVLVDPFASVGLFLGLTPGYSRRERFKIAIKASAFAAIVLIIFATAGRVVLDYLGIELYALKAAGGLLLTIIGLNMLKEGREIPRKEIDLITGGDFDPTTPKGDPSLVPLGIPMLAGPGAISLVIVQRTAFGLTTVVTAVSLALLGSAIILMVAARMQKLLGASGERVITRIMGILTVAFAMQYLFEGISDWWVLQP